MSTMTRLATRFLTTATLVFFAAGAPGQGEATVLRGGRIHVRPGNVLEGADVLIEKDVIKAVGRDLKVPEGAAVVELEGADLYPAFIDPLNDGLLEQGHAAKGAFGAGEPTLDAFDPFLRTYDRDLLASGVATVGLGALPQGVRGGVVSVIALGSRPGEPSVIARNQIVPCEISALERVARAEPGSGERGGRRGGFGGFGGGEAVAMVPTTSVLMREAAAKAIDELLEAAKRYRESLEKYEKDFAEYEKKLAEWEKTKGTDSRPASRPESERPAPDPERRRPEGGGGGGGRRGGFRRPPGPAPAPEQPETASGPSTTASGRPKAPEKPRVEPGKESLGRVLKRETPLWIVAHWASDIDAALDLAKSKNIRVVLVGATEALRRLEAIKAARVVVALGCPVTVEPDNLDRMMHREDLCAALAKAGVPVTFYTAGDPTLGPTGLPLVAALGMGWGMTEDQALAAVTVNAARSLGLEKKMGSIEPGRIASLFTCRGSPFAPDVRAARVWVRGKPVLPEAN
jgi:hypothetical protein